MHESSDFVFLKIFVHFYTFYTTWKICFLQKKKSNIWLTQQLESVSLYSEITELTYSELLEESLRVSVHCVINFQLQKYLFLESVNSWFWL